jgi:dTDP-4-amino-4,6-dideoxygalactose transaminase
MQSLPGRRLPSDADNTGRDLGAPELELLAAAIRSGTLISTRGALTPRLERAFAEHMGVPHAVACASGSAALHAAVAALQLELGSEVITSPITDMGAVMPLLYEGLVPVFCDVDPDTGNATAEAIAQRLTPRTRAVIVTHLFGRPCEMRPILELARAHDLVVIEDCAQAFLARADAGPVGSLGSLAVYSFQQGKHMTTGEGGMVVAQQPELASRVRKFVNKGWGYGEARPDHDFPALNYRMTELQAAVGLPQLAKLDAAVARRRAAAARLRAGLRDLPGVAMPSCPPGVAHSYWRVALLVAPDAVPGGPAALAAQLAARGLAAQPHYIGKPAYRCRALAEWQRFAVTRAVFERAGRGPEPPPGTMPGTERALARMLVLPWNERYEPEHVDVVVEALAAALRGAQRADGPADATEEAASDAPAVVAAATRSSLPRR